MIDLQSLTNTRSDGFELFLNLLPLRKLLIKERTNLKLPFVKDYNKQIDEFILYGYPSFLVYKSCTFENYQYLLAFKEVTLQLSEIIGVDLSENVTKQLEAIGDSINTINFYLREMSDHILNSISNVGSIKYPLQTFTPDPSITLSGLASRKNESLEVFSKKLDGLSS